jgi:DNA-directed RNA polymerase I, II, and III subunit RPABC3
MLFEDNFDVTGVNPDGKKFDKGQRRSTRAIVGTASNRSGREVVDHWKLTLDSALFHSPPVNRLICSSDNGLDMVLDINSQLYKLELGDKFSLMLASTLNLDGTPDANEFNQSGDPSLADNYEYVMHGKVFKVQQSGNEGKMEVFTSYGGLLMSLKGQPINLSKIELDQRMYLLIKKIGA